MYLSLIIPIIIYILHHFAQSSCWRKYFIKKILTCRRCDAALLLSCLSVRDLLSLWFKSHGSLHFLICIILQCWMGGLLALS
jgi:hypothetical protein